MMLTGIYINLANVFYMHHCFHDCECFIWIKCACRGAGRGCPLSAHGRVRERESKRKRAKERGVTSIRNERSGADSGGV